MRVIAGSLGGRRLTAPRGRRTRPTSDRVREALFMSLEPLMGLRVVDLFAGSGALGIEALSRGARHADFVEHNRFARAALARNITELQLLDRATIWPLDLPGGLNQIEAQLRVADLVVVDPPYGGREARAVLSALGEPGRLKAGARVVVEHHTKDTLETERGTLARMRERRYGETMVTTYQVAGDPPAETEERRP